MINLKEEAVNETQAQMVWSTIRSLPDGEHILGRDLMRIAGMTDKRAFYKIIEEYREAGIFIGANRHSPRGYYEIRTEADFIRFLERKFAELEREKEVLWSMHRKWYRKRIPNYMDWPDTEVVVEENDEDLMEENTEKDNE